MSVHLQSHMHLASTLFGKHCTHRIEGTLSSLHVIIYGRRFMCMRSHSEKIQWKMGCTSLINLERRLSKTVGRQLVKLNLSEQKVDMPLVVTKDVVHHDVETLCHLFPRLRLEQLVLIGNNLSRASFESNHFTQEHIDKVVGRHIAAARHEHSMLGESVDHRRDGVMTSSGRRQS